MQCAISGQPPKEPVVSPKSGLIFERTLIEQYIAQHNQDPVTSEPLAVEDLIALKPSPYQLPRQPQLNSVPSLLSALQNEWDSLALQVFQLTKQLDDARKELSTALYHQDAAVRVAAKAIKERDEARNALEELTLSISGQTAIEAPVQQEEQIQQQQQQQQVSGSIPGDLVQQITDANNELFAIHKASKQKPNVNGQLTTVEQTSHGKPFKKLISTNVTEDKQIYLTSTTGITSVFDVASSSIIKDETVPKDKHISVILKHQAHTIIAHTSGQITVNGTLLPSYTSQPIIKLLPHPSLPLFISVSSSGQYAIHTITSEPSTVFHSSVSSGVTSADIHLDGALVALGGDNGLVYLIDLRTGEVASSFQSGTGAESEIQDLKFGRNGYWLFSCIGGNSIEVWDLRKESSVVVEVKNNLTKIITDKSSQILLAVSEKAMELVQYEKSSKSWVWKNQFDLSLEDSSDFITEAAIENDTVKDELKVAVVTSESNVIGVTFK